MDTSEPVVLLRVKPRKISNTSRHSYIEAVGIWEGGGPLGKGDNIYKIKYT